MDFGFIHGGMHGAWCWEFVRLELESAGHRVFLANLPCEDTTAGGERAALSAVESFRGAGPELVVVAHSIGGLVAPLVATMRPVRSVSLCAGLPAIGRSFIDQIQNDGVSTPGNNAAATFDELNRVIYTEAQAREYLFYDCPESVARWAFANLRPQATLVQTEINAVTRVAALSISLDHHARRPGREQ